MKVFVLLPVLAQFVMSQNMGQCYEANRPKPEPKPQQPEPQPNDNGNNGNQGPPQQPEDPKPAPVEPGKGARIAGIDFTSDEMANSYRGLRKAMQVVGEPESNDFQSDCLRMTNTYRAVLGLRPMRYSAAAYRVAQSYANKLAYTNRFEHSHIKGYGENLYRTSGGSFACHKAMNAFFEEYALYHGEPIGRGNFEGYGHFTQLIWPDTLEMACAKAVHPRDPRTQTIVCNYIEPGNMMGTKLAVRMGNTGYMK